MKVLLASAQASNVLSGLKNLLPSNVQLVVPKNRAEKELIQLAGDVEVIVCTRLSKEVAQAAKKLKLVQKTGAGIDAIPLDDLRSDVAVANTSGANSASMAEGTVALVLALAKQIVNRHNLFPNGDSTTRRGVELRGKTAGIVGLGHIGVETARLLKAFGMKILAIKRNPADISDIGFTPDFLSGQRDLDYLLRESDFVILVAPSTPETRGMIGERELHLMRPTAYLVNVARGDLIQEEPLYRALKERWIAGAALDVWWPDHWWDPAWDTYGQSPKYAIWKLPNVIATPHNIGSADTRSDAGLRIIAENIRRVAEGKPPINQVNKALQY